MLSWEFSMPLYLMSLLGWGDDSLHRYPACAAVRRQRRAPPTEAVTENGGVGKLRFSLDSGAAYSIRRHCRDSDAHHGEPHYARRAWPAARRGGAIAARHLSRGER